MELSAILKIAEYAFGYIPALVKLAELVFSDKPKSGAEKKNFVVQILKGIVGGFKKFSTRGQKDTWDEIAPVVESAIDVTAGQIFPSVSPAESE